MTDALPVVIIGAGPVGLAAAARLIERDAPFVILEAGRAVGEAIRAWGHVRLFSPWRYNIDTAAQVLLEGTGWSAPEFEALPTGHELCERYLEPLSRHPRIAEHLVLGARATGIARAGLDKMSSTDREAAPFTVTWLDASGQVHRLKARAAIDATGTWGQPNPIGVDGLAVPGEQEAADRIAYGIPDVLGADRSAYAGRRVLVVGSGHSAINVALDLLRLKAEVPATEIVWALRRNRVDRLLGGGLNDQLPERGALGLAAQEAIGAGRLSLLAPFAAERITRRDDDLLVEASIDDAATSLAFDRIVVATGFRPELGLLREVRVAIDPITEAPPALAPLIDPNLHSCGTVPPHGAVELAHPEPGLFIVGAKSYGRAPTFLMATGFEQVRSVVAELVGDHVAAREVRLVLPETGVCSAPDVIEVVAGDCCGERAIRINDAACCSPAAKPATVEACCAPAEPASRCCGAAA